jgi:hypothetical protein
VDRACGDNHPGFAPLNTGLQLHGYKAAGTGPRYGL